MKYLILISLLCSFLFAENINEHKIDLYFGNGIQNSFKEANQAGSDLANKLFKKNLSFSKNFLEENQFNNFESSYKLAYNHSFGITDDLLEALMQKVESNELDPSLLYLTNLKLHPLHTIFVNLFDYRKTIEESETLTYEQKEYLLVNFIERWENDTILFESTAELNEFTLKLNEFDKLNQLKGYKEDIALGHKIMLVAHSQGNLFANQVYKDLEEWEKEYIEMYGVGSPSNNFFGKVTTSIEDYISNESDPVGLLGSKRNFVLTEEEKDTYEMRINDSLISSYIDLSANSTEYLFLYNALSFINNSYGNEFIPGHLMKNYLQIPSQLEAILNGVEGKSTKLLNKSSQYSANYNEDPCLPSVFTHKNLEKDFSGLSFNKKYINHTTDNLAENSIYLNQIISTPEDEVFCYKDDTNTYKIRRETYTPENITIENVSNVGYKVEGKMNEFEAAGEYKGYLKNSEGIIESTTFEVEKINEELIFKTSFNSKTEGKFEFYIEGKFGETILVSNEASLTIDNSSFNDQLTYEIVESEIYGEQIKVSFEDPKAINYILIVDKKTKEGNFNEFDRINILNSDRKTDYLIEKQYFNGVYKIKVEKENSIHEKTILSRNKELKINMLKGSIKKIPSTIFKLQNYMDYYYSETKILRSDIDFPYKGYLVLYNNKTGQETNLQYMGTYKNYTIKYLLNGDSIDLTLKLFNSSKEVVDEVKIQENLEVPFSYSNLKFEVQNENCLNPVESKYRVYTKVFHADKLSIYLNGNKVTEINPRNTTIVENLIFDTRKENNIQIKIENTKIDKKEVTVLNANFNPENTQCKSFSNLFSFNTQEDENGNLNKINYIAKYNTGVHNVPGKIEVFLNDNLIKTLYDTDLRNNEISNSVAVDYNISNKITLKVYGLYQEIIRNTFTKTF